MTPSTPADLPEHDNALQPGARLGEFEIQGVIGVGGFGIVYRALDHDLLQPGQRAGRRADPLEDLEPAVGQVQQRSRQSGSP